MSQSRMPNYSFHCPGSLSLCVAACLHCHAFEKSFASRNDPPSLNGPAALICPLFLNCSVPLKCAVALIWRTFLHCPAFPGWRTSLDCPVVRTEAKQLPRSLPPWRLGSRRQSSSSAGRCCRRPGPCLPLPVPYSPLPVLVPLHPSPLVRLLSCALLLALAPLRWVPRHLLRRLRTSTAFFGFEDPCPV